MSAQSTFAQTFTRADEQHFWGLATFKFCEDTIVSNVSDAENYKAAIIAVEADFQELKRLADSDDEFALWFDVNVFNKIRDLPQPFICLAGSSYLAGVASQM